MPSTPTKSTSDATSSAQKKPAKPSAKTKRAEAAPEKVAALGIEKDERFVYFVDRRGNLLRMERGVAKPSCDIVMEKVVRREKGYLYFLDDDGDLVREPDSSRDG